MRIAKRDEKLFKIIREEVATPIDLKSAEAELALLEGSMVSLSDDFTHPDKDYADFKNMERLREAAVLTPRLNDARETVREIKALG